MIDVLVFIGSALFIFLGLLALMPIKGSERIPIAVRIFAGTSGVFVGMYAYTTYFLL